MLINNVNNTKKIQNLNRYYFVYKIKVDQGTELTTISQLRNTNECTIERCLRQTFRRQ